jgi:hypothetical protein
MDTSAGGVAVAFTTFNNSLLSLRLISNLREGAQSLVSYLAISAVLSLLARERKGATLRNDGQRNDERNYFYGLKLNMQN